ncbi:hypothetical protein ACWD5Q_21795 [Streptomyces sp. NPDC002513]
MNKLARRIATAAVSAAFAGGALFVAGGPAAAAAPAGQHSARVTVAQGGHGDAAEHVTVNGSVAPWIADQLARYEHVTVNDRTDPWIADQLATYDQSVADRTATYDPWIMDQLARFAAPAAAQASLR